MDSGIDASHPDLQGRIATALCADFTQHYWQTVPSDSVGHGTHVAGIIAANIDNDRGIAGAAGNVKIAAFRVFNAEGEALSSTVALAINYAEELGLPILNYSGSWKPDSLYQYTNYDLALDEVIDNYSGLFICASGNMHANIDTTAVYPASLNNDNLLVVGASTSAQTMYYSSGYGAMSVDVFAPGENILSCFSTNKCPGNTCGSELHHAEAYHYDSGTSFAAPYVTAIAALMLSENPNLTPLQIKNKIIDTCTDVTAFANKCVSGGVVNAYRALLKAPSFVTMSANSSRSASLNAGRHYWVKFTAPQTGTYTFATTGSLHTVGELYDDNGILVRSSNANSSTSSNFNITEDLAYGDVVYLRISIKGTPASGSFTVHIAT